MVSWSSTLLIFFFGITLAQYNPFQQRYQYGNNNINNNVGQQLQGTRQDPRYNQPMQQPGAYQNQQQQSLYPQQQQAQQLQQPGRYQQQQLQPNYGGQSNGLNQYGQNQYQPNQQQNRNSGSSSGLLGNPIRPMNSAFSNFSTPNGRALFGLRIASYSIGRQDVTCSTTPCSYSFSIVMATLEATVNYESSNFIPLNGSQLADGGWHDEIYINISTKPVSVDIFVHSRGLTIGNVDGNYSLGVPVQHVNTFVLDLRDYNPFGANGSITRTTMSLQDSKPNSQSGASITLEYFIQCLGNFLGPNCDYTCTPVGTNNMAQCTSVLDPKERHACKYDQTQSQIQKDSCDYCSQGFASNGSCLPLSFTGTAMGVSRAYKTWTIVLACLLALALLIIIFLILLKIITDSRNRRAQQYPQNRNPSAYSGGYRPNAGTGETPLLGITEKEWERERQPAALRRVEAESTQNSESFQETRGGSYHPPTAQHPRREAQV